VDHHLPQPAISLIKNFDQMSLVSDKRLVAITFMQWSQWSLLYSSMLSTCGFKIKKMLRLYHHLQFMYTTLFGPEALPSPFKRFMVEVGPPCDLPGISSTYHPNGQ